MRKETVYDLGVSCFRNTILRENKQGDKIKNLLLDIIKKDRNGELVDKMLCKKAVNMLYDTRSYEEFLEVFF
jgi:hypothetical protein